MPHSRPVIVPRDYKCGGRPPLRVTVRYDVEKHTHADSSFGCSGGPKAKDGGMTLTMLPGATPEQVLSTFDVLLNGLAGYQGGDKFDVFNHYIRWANDAAGRLAALLSREHIDRLILTPRHWTLCGIDPGVNEVLMDIVQAEVLDRTRDLKDARDTLKGTLEQWEARPGQIIVADTNVYLHHEDFFTDLDWMAVAGPGEHQQLQLVIPLIVVDELDRAKRGKDTVRLRARHTLRSLDELFSQPQSEVSSRGVMLNHRVRAHILIDDPRHNRLPDADAELIDRAALLSRVACRSVALITFDTGMALRARTAGLKVRRPPASSDRTARDH